MSTEAIRLYKLLKTQFADEVAQEIADLLEKNSVDPQNILTQKDKVDLITRINGVKTDINNNMWKLAAYLTTVIALAVTLSKLL